MDEEQIASLVFFTTLDDWIESRTRQNFYDASAYLFVKYAKRACMLTLPGENPINSPINRFYGDSILLLQNYNSFCGAKNADYGFHAGAFVQFFHLYQQSLNAVHGRRVTDTELGAATIRLAIEARLKRAVGIFSTFSPKSSKSSPVKMSIIFASLKELRSKIETAVEFEVVKKIYSWSNNYIHTGMRSPTWLNYFAHDLIEPLFIPSYLKKGSSFDFGLAMEKQTLLALRELIRTKSGPDSILEGPSVDDCAVGLV